MQQPKLLHLLTGGTISGVVPEYVEIEQIGELFGDSINFEKHITKSFKAPVQYDSVEICKKDSRGINDDDRDATISSIESAYGQGTKLFLITHGTFTMAETGEYLIDRLSDSILQNVSIILTGAMYPWNVYGSDAPFNLGASISQLINNQVVGVWICMHGKLFDPRKVTKDAEKRVFE